MKKITTILLAASILTTTMLQASVVTEPTTATNSSTATSSKEVVIDDAVVNDAMSQFKSLSRVERKMRLQEVKAKMKEFKANKATAQPSTNTLLLVILALLLPPLAVYLHEGAINGKFWLNLILTLLFFIPGVIHALIVVLS